MSRQTELEKEEQEYLYRMNEAFRDVVFAHESPVKLFKKGPGNAKKKRSNMNHVGHQLRRKHRRSKQNKT